MRLLFTVPYTQFFQFHGFSRDWMYAKMIKDNEDIYKGCKSKTFNFLLLCIC
uniref:Uncharacterized protein n=1 Tax=Rhizophora mucronata TaxID=61149 RepID=A0A2P2PCM7_RHIMU